MKRMHPTRFEDYSDRSKRRIRRKRREAARSEPHGSQDLTVGNSENDDELQSGLIENVNSPVGSVTDPADGSESSRVLNSSSGSNLSSWEADTDSSSLSATDDTAGRSDFEDDEEHVGDFDALEDGQPGAPDGGPPDDGDLPIYDGAPISVAQSLLSIMSFFLSHQLTGSALADLLHLINLHCVKPNRCSESLYKFKKYFRNYKFPLKRHFFCSICFQKVESKDSLCPQDNTHEGVSHFVEIPVKDQLKCLMSRPGFYDMLNYRFERNKANVDNFEDVYDGECYKKLSSDGGLLSSRNNVSFMWYLDGVKVFKSSKLQIWPLTFVLNELKYKERIKRDNMLLAGLWFGNSKPVPEIFLEPFHETFAELRDGIEVNVPPLLDPIIIKAIVLNGTADLPAKSCFLNFIQYSGKHGCPVCEIQGRRVPSDDAQDENGQVQRIGSVQVYPFQRDVVLRSEASTLQMAEEAARVQKPVCGVKGPSSLLYFLLINYVISTSIDVMHCLWANVIPLLLNLWFLPAHHNEPYSLSRVIAIVDNRMSRITPPSNIYRSPRGVSDRAHWKSAENMFWFFMYSLSILPDLMVPEYFDHNLLLVKSMYILCSRSISVHDLALSSRLLTEYVSRFEDRYGVRYMTINFHSLLHLPLIVERLGPLYVTSCFPLESYNGVLKNLVHGTRFVDSQICSVASLLAHSTSLKKQFLIPGSDAFKFCHAMDHRSLRYRVVRISPSVFVVGNFKKVEPLPPLIENVLDDRDVRANNCYLFYRLLINGTLFVSESYSQVLKRNSTFVTYLSASNKFIGRIRSFVQVKNCNCQGHCGCEAQYYAIITRVNTINPYIVNSNQLRISFVHKISSDGSTEAIDCNKLRKVCFFNCLKTITNEETRFVIEPPDTPDVM